MSPSLYIHIPFCQKKCFFCSFAVAASQMHKRDDYIEALGKEAMLYQGREISTLYIGGGTPSCLEIDQLHKLWSQVVGRFNLSEEKEKTFEINPESIDDKKAQTLRALGINRVSLGVQSLSDTRLEYLGRPHNAEQARRAFSVIRAAGFTNVSVDLMYGFPGQTEADLREDIRGILSFGAEHISLYSLSVEERSLFHARKEPVDSQTQADFYVLILQELEAAGYRQYEISNFARLGFESAHNFNYWRQGEYVGLGMAAHSYLDGRRFWNVDTLPAYLTRMREVGRAEAGHEILEPHARFMEAFLFALRMNEGIDLYSLERKMNTRFPQEKLDELSSLIEMGFLEEDGKFIRATDKGRLVLDEISARLI